MSGFLIGTALLHIYAIIASLFLRSVTIAPNTIGYESFMAKDNRIHPLPAEIMLPLTRNGTYSIGDANMNEILSLHAGNLDEVVVSLSSYQLYWVAVLDSDKPCKGNIIQ